MNKYLGSIFALCGVLITGTIFFRLPDTPKLVAADLAAPSVTVRIEESLETSEEVPDYLTTEDFPKVDLTDWSLLLVGPLHKLTKEIPETQLKNLDNGYQVHQNIVDAYQAFVKAAQTDGIDLVMISAFRSVASQRDVFDANVRTLIAQGRSEEEAIAVTKLTFTEPGYSEHHTGLAIDVVDRNWYDSYPNSVLDEAFGEAPGGKWLQANARNYGFIVRYPKNREAITKITYEPWHLRYVGVPVAQYIEEHQLTLEEFLEQAKEREVRNENAS